DDAARDLVEAGEQRPRVADALRRRLGDHLVTGLWRGVGWLRAARRPRDRRARKRLPPPPAPPTPGRRERPRLDASRGARRTGSRWIASRRRVGVGRRIVRLRRIILARRIIRLRRWVVRLRWVVSLRRRRLLTPARNIRWRARRRPENRA